MYPASSKHLSLGELLTEATVELELEGQQRDEIFRGLIFRVPQLTGRKDAQETLLKALHEREDMHSTGVGDGVALPHARNALVGLVEKPVVVFGRHKKGVQFGAIDNKPAHLFFLLIAPNVTTHLAMLSRISRLVRSPKLRQGLLVAELPEQVIELIRDAEVESQS